MREKLLKSGQGRRKRKETSRRRFMLIKSPLLRTCPVLLLLISCCCCCYLSCAPSSQLLTLDEKMRLLKRRLEAGDMIRIMKRTGPRLSRTKKKRLKTLLPINFLQLCRVIKESAAPDHILHSSLSSRRRPPPPLIKTKSIGTITFRRRPLPY